MQSMVSELDGAGSEVSGFIEGLRKRGIVLRVQGEALICDAPRSALSPGDRERIGAMKPDIVRYLSRTSEGGVRSGRIPRVPRDRPIPLGLVQQRMWLLDTLDRTSTVNNLPGAWRLAGQLDAQAFAAALTEITRRHEILRTRIASNAGEPLQVIDDEFRPTLPIVDLRHLTGEDRSNEMMRQIREERDTPFDLAELPLFRVRLYRLADEEHVLFVLPHHVIWDGWSWDVFHDELSALYDAFRSGRPSPIPDLDVQYADYAVWHRNLMSGPELHRQVAYWRNQLGGAIPLLQLPTDRPRPATLSQIGDRRLLDLDDDLIERLWQIGRSEDATLFMVLLTAYAAWLLRYTGQDDLTIGVPTQDRLEEGADRLIGVFVNTLVIRVRLSERPTFRELLRQVRDTCIEAYDHQDIPFDRLVDELGVQRSPSHTPIYQTLFTYQDVTKRPQRIGDLTMSQVHVDTGVAPTDVLFGVMVGRQGTVALLDFNADLFEPESMSRMAASFDALVHDVARDPNRQVARLSLIGARNQKKDGDGSDLFALSRGEQEQADTGLLTYGQEGMWFVERATRGTPVHHIVEAYRMRGDVSVSLLNRAFAVIAQRHGVLRCRFPEVNGEPRCETAADIGDVIRHERLSGTAESDIVTEKLAIEARAAFDVERGPLIRGLLLELDRGEYLLQLVFHHLIVDEPSLAILYRDLADTCDALARGAAPPSEPDPAPFTLYANQSHHALDTAVVRGQLDYWSERLADPAPPLDVADRTRPPLLSLAGASVPLHLGTELSAAIDRAAVETGTSPLAFVLSALQAVFHRYTGESRIAVGVPVQRRPSGEEWERTVGLFLNMVVIDADTSDERPFSEQLRRNHDAAREAEANGDVPFSKVVEQVQPARSLNHSPLFQVLLSVESRPAATLRIQGIEVEPVFRERPGLQTDLAVYLNRETDGWRGRIDYSTDLFERVTVERLAGHLNAILDAAVDAGDVVMGELEMLSPAERTRLLSEWNATDREVRDSTVLEGIAARVQASPDATAVSQESDAISYAELWQRSGSIARALNARDIGKGSVVGVCFERTPSMVIAMLAVWRSGAAYVPLDPDFPEDRLRFVAEDSQCQLVLTDGVAQDVLPRDFSGIVMLSDMESEGQGHDRPLPLPAADDLAYIIYTSGSTGRPKGVELEHGSLVNFMTSMAVEPGLVADDVLLAVTTPSFDISILELFLPLCVGAHVVIATDDEVRDGELLAERIADDEVTVMQATPATWRMLLGAGWSGRLRKLISGGEAFPPELVPPLLARADEVWNVYGPTETTIWSTAARVEHAPVGAVEIGRPIANTRVYVVDGRGRLSPQGMPGELWIGGRGVARGYHDRPDLTAGRFLPDPFADDVRSTRNRVYRTGDLVRWRGDGNLEHLGRLDDQVKVNGHRIELGEIEATLAEHPDIGQSVVAVQQGGDDERRLVAYVVWRSSQPLLAGEVRRYLGRRLPDYMVPGLIVELDALPLTPNGKVDRKALPNPLEVVAVREHVEPDTPLQRTVAAVWSTLLGQERIGLHDNFFELGGYSLLSIRAVAMIEEQTGLRLDPRSMFFQTLEQVVAEGERHAQLVAAPA